MSKAGVMRLTKFITQISSVSGLELAMAQTCGNEPRKNSDDFFPQWFVTVTFLA